MVGEAEQGQARAQAYMYGTSTYLLGHGQLLKDTKKEDGVIELAQSKQKVTDSLKICRWSWGAFAGFVCLAPLLPSLC